MFRSRAGEEFARYFRNKDPAFEKIPILVMYTDEAVTEETFVPNYDSFVRMPFYWQFPFISITSESKRSVMTICRRLSEGIKLEADESLVNLI